MEMAGRLSSVIRQKKTIVVGSSPTMHTLVLRKEKQYS